MPLPATSDCKLRPKSSRAVHVGRPSQNVITGDNMALLCHPARFASFDVCEGTFHRGWLAAVGRGLSMSASGRQEI